MTRLLACVLFLAGCDGALKARGVDAGAGGRADAASVVDTAARETAASETTKPDEKLDTKTTISCAASDGFECDEFTSAAPPVDCLPFMGPCRQPESPSDVCVMAPGHLRYYYHVILVFDGGPPEGVPYGAWPPDTCRRP